ncbi:Nucleoid occlusion protein [uncultured archaeon]|nr:Nucleoid occlusion protein [uncultured archaeon]
MKKEKKAKNIDVVSGIPGPEKRSVTQICDISLIDLTGWNPRCEDSFKDEEFEELKQSMKENGFFKHEPLLVRPAAEAFRFELIAGHRRLQAAKELGFTEVPVSIQYISDPDAKLLLFIDNFHRKDFSPLEEAQGIKMVLDDGAITQTELGKKMGKSQAYVANRLRLLDAPQELKDLIISHEITPSHVNVLMPFVGYPVFGQFMENIKDHISDYGKVSVKDLEDDILPDSIRNNDSVLNLDNFDYDQRHVREFFDFLDCETCNHVVSVDQYGQNIRVCLEQGCWYPRMTAAGELYNKSQEERKKKLLETPEDLKVDDLKYGEYETLNIKYHPWIKNCDGCDKRKIRDGKEMGNEVCLDPVCYKKNDAAYTKEQQKIEREEDKKAWELLDKRIANIVAFDQKQVRWLLDSLADKLWSEAMQIGLAPWDKVKRGESPDIKKVPDEDIPKAIIRSVIAREFISRKANHESMELILKGLGV